MAAAGIADFLRRRKLMIIVAAVLLFGVAMFLRVRTSSRRTINTSRNAPTSQQGPAKSEPVIQVDKIEKPQKDHKDEVKQLPPLLGRFRDKIKKPSQPGGGDKSWPQDGAGKDAGDDWPEEELVDLSGNQGKKEHPEEVRFPDFPDLKKEEISEDDLPDLERVLKKDREGEEGGEEGKKEEEEGGGGNLVPGPEEGDMGEVGGEAPPIPTNDVEKQRPKEAPEENPHLVEWEPQSHNAAPLPQGPEVEEGEGEGPGQQPAGEQTLPNQQVPPSQPEQPGNQYPQQSGNQDPQQSGNQYPQQSGNQYPQQPENQDPQQSGNQYPEQPGNQYPQQPGNQQSGNQYPEQPGNQPGSLNQNVDQTGAADHSSEPAVNPQGPVNPQGSLTQDSANDPSPLYVQSSMPLGAPLSPSSSRPPRQEAVVNAFKHAWKAYKKYAWGQDEVNPISHSGSSNPFGMGMTLVDSLDTLWLMGLREEFTEARDWVAQRLDIDRNSKTVSLFETNIRVLGGLLSAYHLSEDTVFLDKAKKLGSRLLPAFQTPSGVPSNTVSLSNGAHNGRGITVAEAGTLQLEFRDLSRASGNPAYQKACDRTVDKILSQSRGMVRQNLNPQTGHFSGSMYSVGAGIDSYYEYLLKQWIQSGRTEDKFQEAYVHSVTDVLHHLVGYTSPSHMAFVGSKFTLNSSPPSPSMDHLSCFYPGMLALGVMYDLQPGNSREMAANLTHTCYFMYNSTAPTGLAPDAFQFNTDPHRVNDLLPSPSMQNLQRPETVESLFYLYRLTKDQRYREWGWNIFQSFERYTKLRDGGYACLRNVRTTGNFRDRMESFFLAETLKYLYLLFEDDDSVLSLREWVFNTEAHPLPIWRMSNTS